MNVLNRALTVAALIALAVTLGVWLSRPPVTAAPPAETSPQPILASPPIRALPVATPAALEVLVEAEIATPAPTVADQPLAVKPAEASSEPRPTCQPRRRGLFRRR